METHQTVRSVMLFVTNGGYELAAVTVVPSTSNIKHGFSPQNSIHQLSPKFNKTLIVLCILNELKLLQLKVTHELDKCIKTIPCTNPPGPVHRRCERPKSKTDLNEWPKIKALFLAINTHLASYHNDHLKGIVVINLNLHLGIYLYIMFA